MTGTETETETEKDTETARALPGWLQRVVRAQDKDATHRPLGADKLLPQVAEW